MPSVLLGRQAEALEVLEAAELQFSLLTINYYPHSIIRASFQLLNRRDLLSMYLIIHVVLWVNHKRLKHGSQDINLQYLSKQEQEQE